LIPTPYSILHTPYCILHTQYCLPVQNSLLDQYNPFYLPSLDLQCRGTGINRSFLTTIRSPQSAIRDPRFIFSTHLKIHTHPKVSTFLTIAPLASRRNSQIPNPKRVILTRSEPRQTHTRGREKEFSLPARRFLFCLLLPPGCLPLQQSALSCRCI
jgi:hypothetical protein